MSIFKRATMFGWFVCSLGALFYCYEYFLRITPSVMTTQLMHAFNINATLLGNLAAFYYYAYTPMQIPVGVMMDRYGPRRLLILAILICSIGTLLFASPDHLYLAYFGRFLIGFGSAFGFVGVLKLSTIWLPARYFSFVTGITTTLGMLGGMFGSFYLDKIVRMNGWEITMKYSSIAAIILAILFIINMPSHHKLEEEEGQANTASYSLLFTNLWQLSKNPLIWVNGLVGCFLYLSLSVFSELWGPKYLEVAHHLTSSQSVSATGKIFLAWAIGGPLVGILAVDYCRSIYILMTGSLIAFVASMILITGHNLSFLQIQIILFFFGLGSVAEILTFNIARITTDHASSGTAIAFTNMLVMLGGSIFEPAVGKLLDVFWKGDAAIALGNRVYSASNFNHAMMILPLGCIACFLLLLYMLRYKSRYEEHVR